MSTGLIAERMQGHRIAEFLVLEKQLPTISESLCTLMLPFTNDHSCTYSPLTGDALCQSQDCIILEVNTVCFEPYRLL